jgi:hypothetical protein
MRGSLSPVVVAVIFAKNGKMAGLSLGFDGPGTVTVPQPKKDLGKGLVQTIRKQAGLK